MGLADRKRRRSIRENAHANNAKSSDDVGKEVSYDDHEALPRPSHEFFDSLVLAHPVHVVLAVPTSKHVAVLNDLSFFLIKICIANDLVEMCLLNYMLLLLVCFGRYVYVLRLIFARIVQS